MRGFRNASAIKTSIVLWLIFGLQLNTIELICEQLLITSISPESVMFGES
jgi:hypothetical protein